MWLVWDRLAGLDRSSGGVTRVYTGAEILISL